MTFVTNRKETLMPLTGKENLKCNFTGMEGLKGNIYLLSAFARYCAWGLADGLHNNEQRF